MEQQDSSESPVQLTTSVSAPSKPRVSDRKRLPRNRNLLESVQAHLTLGTQERATRVHSDNTTSMLRDSRAPSLQTRLSDTNTDTPQPAPESEPNKGHSTCGKDVMLRNGMSAPEIMARTRARHARNNITPGSAIAIQSRGPESSSLLSNGCEGALSLPLPREWEETRIHRGGLVSDIDISRTERYWVMDQAAKSSKSQTQFSRASENISARRTQQESPQLATSGPSSIALLPLHESHHHVAPTNPAGGISVNSDSSAKPASIKNILRHSSISPLGARNRLLAKLEEERNHARGASSTVAVENSFPALHGTFLGPDDRLPLNPAPFTNFNTVDTHSIEAELRARTQLRVRLAAERKQAEGSGANPEQLSRSRIQVHENIESTN